MREENPSEKRVKASKFADQNQIPKPQSQNSKGNNNGSNPSKLRSASSWGSQIVKGFSSATDRKTKASQQPTLTVTVHTKKPQPLLSSSDSSTNQNQKNPFVPSHSRVKRSLIGDLSCSVSVNAAQVHVHPHRRQSSRDLFTELENLRSLLQQSKDREFKLQAELSECKRNPKVLDLERELDVKRAELDDLVRKIGLLEFEKVEKTSLSDHLSEVSSSRGEEDNENSSVTLSTSSTSLEMEVVELRRLNKELQLEKRNLACGLASMDSQLASLAKASEEVIVLSD